MTYEASISWDLFLHLVHQYILVAMDYVSKWVEAISSTKNDVVMVSKFLKKNIFSHFGMPRALIRDKGTHFINRIISDKFNVKT